MNKQELKAAMAEAESYMNNEKFSDNLRSEAFKEYLSCSRKLKELCPCCDGKGYFNDGSECPDCDGTGNNSSPE